MGAVETLRPLMEGKRLSGRSVFSLSSSRWLMGGRASLLESQHRGPDGYRFVGGTYRCLLAASGVAMVVEQETVLLGTQISTLELSTMWTDLFRFVVAVGCRADSRQGCHRGEAAAGIRRFASLVRNVGRGRVGQRMGRGICHRLSLRPAGG